MISITKIFRFEAAHAIYTYPGSCQNIHGHSYELQVTVHPKQESDGFIPGLGITLDFKVLKACVQESVIKVLDHKLILSKAYLANVKNEFSPSELFVFEHEPTAENLLVFSRNQIRAALPESVGLKSLRLYETRDSFADWSEG